MSTASRTRPYPRALIRTAFAGGAAASIALLAGPASAHVTVAPASAQPGSSAVLTFHVPNEEANAQTTQVDVQIPTDHPIAQLLVKPVAGWTISVRTVTLAKPIVTDDGQFNQAVSEVVWSGGRIAPGQFQDFSVSADPLPENVDQLVFKAIQTYSNGDVVRWIDVAQPGQPEPDHPAPVLALTAGTGTAGTSNTAASGTTTSNAASSSAATSGPDTLARDIALGGLACGLGGLALAALSLRRRTTTSTSESVPAEPVAVPNGQPASRQDSAQGKTAGPRRDRARR